MTHGIDVNANRMVTDRVEVGEYSMVGGNAKLVLGARVPPRSVVAMGSTVIAGLQTESSLYAGSPAVLKKALGAGSYFCRSAGPVPAADIQPPDIQPLA